MKNDNDKTRPANYGRANWGYDTIIDCLQGGEPLPPGTPITRPAGRSLDPERSLNPSAHGDIPDAKNDAYSCPECSAYIRLTKAGVAIKHRRPVSTVRYRAGDYDA